ncbi:MAG: hypothetical protein WEE64_13500 [Dehalococcoidia bacterium]
MSGRTFFIVAVGTAVLAFGVFLFAFIYLLPAVIVATFGDEFEEAVPTIQAYLATTQAEATASAEARTPPPPLTSTPTPPAVDVRNGCGPPLPDVYCENWYRPPPSDCPVSTFEVIRPDGLSGIGSNPFWMVGYPVQPLEPEPRSKRIWIIADGVVGEVTLTGKNLDGPGTITFPSYERDASFSEETPDKTALVLMPPHGIEEDHRTAIVYPSAGCWEFTAELGGETARIVQYVYEE